MYVKLALAFAVASNGFTASSAQHEHTIEDVDWKEFQAMLKLYLCSGNNNWYNKQNSNKNEELLKVRVILSTVTAVVCKVDTYATFLPIVRDIYSPFLIKYPTMRKCYVSALNLMLSRFLCCWEENKTLGIFIRNLRKMIKGHKNNVGVNKTISYLSRNDILSTIYEIARKLKMCTSCPREEFRTIYRRKTRGSGRRVKRVYDIGSWLLTLKSISRLDIHNMDIRNDNFEDKWTVGSTKYLLFICEGFMFCSANYFLDSGVA